MVRVPALRKHCNYLTTSKLLDVPAHAYQLCFESSPQWSSFFASAPEILDYWKQVVKKYDIRKLIRFEQKCTGARWSETVGNWFVQLQDLKTGDTYEDSSDVLMTGEGVLNEWKWPDIEGIHTFQGEILHSANWDPQISLRSVVFPSTHLMVPLSNDNRLTKMAIRTNRWP